jgi:ABC-type Mn2+/Zn2+ transport system permease subunit
MRSSGGRRLELARNLFRPYHIERRRRLHRHAEEQAGRHAVSPDVARTAGIDVRRLDLLYLETFALTIALGLRFLGVLLMGALIIIPAATAKRLARNLTEMLALAVGIAVTATLAGTWPPLSIVKQARASSSPPLLVSCLVLCAGD